MTVWGDKHKDLLRNNARCRRGIMDLAGVVRSAVPCFSLPFNIHAHSPLSALSQHTPVQTTELKGRVGARRSDVGGMGICVQSRRGDEHLGSNATRRHRSSHAPGRGPRG